MRQTIVLCLVLLACGSDDGDGGGGPDAATGGTATINLTGAQTASLPALAVGSRMTSEAFHTIGVTILAPQSPVTSASITVRLPGAPATGSYPASSFEVGVLEVSTSDGKSWTAFSTPAIGTIGTLTLTSVDPLSSSGGTTLYTIHGSLAMSTMVQSQGGAELMMTATF